LPRGTIPERALLVRTVSQEARARRPWQAAGETFG
jgi:hypothetical protein